MTHVENQDILNIHAQKQDTRKEEDEDGAHMKWTLKSRTLV